MNNCSAMPLFDSPEAASKATSRSWGVSECGPNASSRTTVADRSTYRAPRTASVGMKYVLVGGTLVVDGGALVRSVAPGRPIAIEKSAELKP